MTYQIIFTGDMVTDESASRGDFAASGWIDPNWSMFTLFENRGEVPVFVAETMEEVVEGIESHIGATGTADGEDYYSLDTKTDSDGNYWSYAAHVRELAEI